MLRRLMRTASPPIVLLTDFGIRDHFVGVMKGVITGLDPDARLIDLAHDVHPQNVQEGAFLLWSSYRYFPSGSVFVAVVDPGVGTGRRILLVRTHKHWFLAPANGILDLVLGDERVIACYDIPKEGSRFTLPQVSATFHGRDVFAPIAAHLARGVDPELLGSSAPPPTPELKFVTGKPARTAIVLHVDRFGNVVTNIRTDRSGILMDLHSGRTSVRRWVRTYAQAPPRTPCLMIGSSGLVEVTVRNDSAASILKWRAGMNLNIRWA